MKRTLLLLFALVAMGLTNVWAYDFSAVAPSGQTLYYNIVDGNAEVTYQRSSSPQYSNLTGALVIPASVTYDGTTYSVTTIGYSAFYDCSGLTSVAIPNSVTSIGRYAFSYCSNVDTLYYNARNLTTTNDWGTTWDNSYGFRPMTLKHLVIGDSVRTLPNYVFYNQDSLTSVTIGNSVTSIGDYAFSYCSGLTSVTIGNSVTSIGTGAFGGCSGLTSVTIGNSVTSIGQQAFSDCEGLTTATIGENVVEMGIGVFNNCHSLTTLYYNATNCTTMGNSDYPVFMSYNYETNVCSPNTTLTNVVVGNNVTAIPAYAFKDCSGLTSVTIPNSVTTIGERAFYNCSGLTSVTIPNSVTSIGYDAFRGCSGLTSVEYSGNIAGWCSIDFGNYAANPNYYAHNLTIGGSPVAGALVIPSGVSAIKNFTFAYCSGLTSVTIPNSVTSIGSQAFYGCSNVDTLYYNARNLSTTSNWGYSSDNSYGFRPMRLKHLVIGDSVRTLPNYVFYKQDSLTSVTIPNSVTSIGDEAFRNCSGLTSVTIGNSVTTISDYAFAGCSGLTSVTIPNSVTSIEFGTFAGCSSLTSVTIPNSVTSIGGYAFEYCSGLTSVTIPNSVTSIGNYAFRNCSGLTSVTIPNSVTSIGDYAFRNCSGLTSVTIPNSVTSIGWAAFNGCSGLTSVIIPNSVTSIGWAAFAGCSGLTSVTIPNSVTTIGEQAFYGCSGLTEMTVLATVPPSLGDRAFYGVDRNIPVYIPCGRTQYYLARDVWNEFNYYQEVSGAVLTVESNNELWGTAEIQQAHTCTSPTAIIRANAQSGYHFVRWNDNNTDNPRTVTVTADVTYTAYFESDAPTQYTITVVSNDNNMGTVTGSGSYDDGEVITITAVANAGYHFVQWQDGNTDAIRTITVAADKTYTAYFAANQTQGIEDVKPMAVVKVMGDCIAVEGAEGENVLIFDVMGRVIVNEPMAEGKVFRMSRNGVYMVKVGNGKAQKVVVVR